MTESLAVQLDKLRSSMQVLEAQRAILGDAIAPALDAVRQHIAALEAQLQVEAAPPEERRIVTILFTDIVGSTALAEKLDPEDWRAAVAAIHGMAGSRLPQHG